MSFHKIIFPLNFPYRKPFTLLLILWALSDQILQICKSYKVLACHSLQASDVLTHNQKKSPPKLVSRMPLVEADLLYLPIYKITTTKVKLEHMKRPHSAKVKNYRLKYYKMSIIPYCQWDAILHLSSSSPEAFVSSSWTSTTAQKVVHLLTDSLTLQRPKTKTKNSQWLTSPLFCCSSTARCHACDFASSSATDASKRAWQSAMLRAFNLNSYSHRANKAQTHWPAQELVLTVSRTQTDGNHVMYGGYDGLKFKLTRRAFC